MPLTSRKLNSKDCKGLVDRIVIVKHWSARLLSYSGRFKVIRTVLASMQTYWCRHFLFPKAVIKQVNRICCSFFWHGHDGSAKGARVSWDLVCKPKSEGGLGHHDLVSWNLAYVLRNLWDIIICVGSLWVAWIKVYVLKGDSIQKLELKNAYSWNVRKLLQLRSLTDLFINMFGN